MRIRALLIAAASVAFGCAELAPAEAADVTAEKAPSYYPNTYYPPAIMWTGFYTGLHIGGAWGNGSWTDPFTGFPDSPRGSGILGGLQLGLNQQWDWLVAGLEADISFTDLKASGTDAAGMSHTIESSWLSTDTARAGFATGPWLFYGKGGIALGDERNRVNAPTAVTTAAGGAIPAGFSANSSLWSTFIVGWTVGGGVEYALTHNWSTRIEYDYIDFSNVNSIGANVNWTIQRVVGAVNWRF